MAASLPPASATEGKPNWGAARPPASRPPQAGGERPRGVAGMVAAGSRPASPPSGKPCAQRAVPTPAGPAPWVTAERSSFSARPPIGDGRAMPKCGSSARVLKLSSMQTLLLLPDELGEELEPRLTAERRLWRRDPRTLGLGDRWVPARGGWATAQARLSGTMPRAENGGGDGGGAGAGGAGGAGAGRESGKDEDGLLGEGARGGTPTLPLVTPGATAARVAPARTGVGRFLAQMSFPPTPSGRWGVAHHPAAAAAAAAAAAPAWAAAAATEARLSAATPPWAAAPPSCTLPGEPPLP
mmetsp:Transcript_68601/g.146843  ORF Transcript_68601/g.146843 Transcript_68601/m.146843 type:complete len:298 (+) Transcript_68601:627-1520(+)